MTRARIRIGTSGWNYAHWKGAFYPARIGADGMLAAYARYFDAVELNSTFYRLPEVPTLERWAEKVPDGFTFAVKASRYITHIKKLNNPEHTLAPFLERIRVLGDHLGPILFQLPPRFRYNGDRLRSLLEHLPSDLAYAFELRDESWINDEALDLLDRHGAALCYYDLGGLGPPRAELTGTFAYVRLHGPETAYQGAYSEAALDAWAHFLDACARRGYPAWCFFDNDAEAHAPNDARRLQQRLASG